MGFIQVVKRKINNKMVGLIIFLINIKKMIIFLINIKKIIINNNKKIVSQFKQINLGNLNQKYNNLDNFYSKIYLNLKNKFLK